ncbi:Molybdenum-pterin-binding protein MopB [archaeon HR01]|nr:Molybdenum-pterin-binding protein MopB [archaeon HR01]
MVVINLEGKILSLEQDRFELLESISRTSSISSASLQMGISYRTALNWLKDIERRAGGKPVQSFRGGRYKGMTHLTELGRKLLEAYYSAQSIRRPGFVKSFIELRLSARNILTGRVKDVTEGDVISMVSVDLDDRQEVKSVITTDSLKRLKISPGDSVLIILKATETLLMKR